MSEVYGELNIPVFKHQGFLLDELTFDVADRNAQYTTVGNVNAWKVSGIYGPIPGLKFRGDYSEAVRAPNLTEAFLPPSGTFFTVADPCSAENINANANRFKNCAALLAGFPGAAPAGTYVDTAVNLSPPGIVSGNGELTPGTVEELHARSRVAADVRQELLGDRRLLQYRHQERDLAADRPTRSPTTASTVPRSIPPSAT